MALSQKFIESTVDHKFHHDWEKINAVLLKSPHIFLSSFPRSGNGWVRLVLAAIILEANGIDIGPVEVIKKRTNAGVPYNYLSSGKQGYNLEEIFPNIYIFQPNTHYETMSDNVKSLNLPVKLIKTHHLVDCKFSKTIFLFREILSCLTSSSLLLNKAEIENNPRKINDTITYMAKFYKEMLEHYIHQKTKYPEHCLFLNHEVISRSRGNAISEFASVMDFLGMKVDITMIEKVLVKFPFKSGYQKNCEQYINDTTKLLIENLLGKYYERAISISNSQ